MRFDVIHILKDYDLSDDENTTSSVIGSELISKASVVITTADVAGTNKSFTAKLQGSLDGEVWVDVGDEIAGADTADQTVGATFENFLWKYLRVDFSGHEDITEGDLDIKLGYIA